MVKTDVGVHAVPVRPERSAQMETARKSASPTARRVCVGTMGVEVPAGTVDPVNPV